MDQPKPLVDADEDEECSAEKKSDFRDDCACGPNSNSELGVPILVADQQ